MRTTLTLDPDVAHLLKQEARRRGISFKQAVNDAIRRSLAPASPTPSEPYVVRPHPGRLRVGLDPGTFGRVNDEIEAEDAARRGSRR